MYDECPNCGERKSVEYELCYDCNLEEAEDEGRVCECGKFKQPQFDLCFECHKKEQQKRLIAQKQALEKPRNFQKPE